MSYPFGDSAYVSDGGDDVQMTGSSNAAQPIGGQLTDKAKSIFRLPSDTFHHRDFVFDLPPPEMSYADPPAPYNPDTDEQTIEIQNRSDKAPEFDLSAHRVDESADIEGHFNDSRYFRHIALFKSAVGANKIFEDIVARRGMGIQPGQILVNNAFGLYEVEHWPRAKEQVIWTNWAMATAAAEREGRELPPVPSTAKPMFQAAVRDGLQAGSDACWMVTPGTRLGDAINRVMRLRRHAVHPNEYAFLTDRDDWARQSYKVPPIEVHGVIHYRPVLFTFSDGQAAKDILVAKKGLHNGLGGGRRLPARFGGEGAWLPRDEDGDLQPLVNSAAVLSATTTPEAPRMAEKEVQGPDNHGPAGCPPSFHKSSIGTQRNRLSFPNQPAAPSGLRNSMTMAPIDPFSSESKPGSRGSLNLPDSRRGQEMSQGNRTSEMGQKQRHSVASTASSSMTGTWQAHDQPFPRLDMAHQTPPVSRPTSMLASHSPDQRQPPITATHRPQSQGVLEKMGAGQQLPSMAPHQFHEEQAALRPIRVDEPGPTAAQTQNDSEEDPRMAQQERQGTKISTTPVRRGPAPTNMSSLHLTANNITGLQLIGPRRLAIAFNRRLPMLHPAEAQAEASAMMHHGLDMVRDEIANIQHNIIHGLWALPHHQHRSEAECQAQAEDILRAQVSNTLSRWEQNVRGIDYPAAQVTGKDQLQLLGFYMYMTLGQSHPLPHGASQAQRVRWVQCRDLEAKKWRLEMLTAWTRMFEGQRLEALRRPENVKFKTFADGSFIDLSSMQRYG